MEPLPDLDAVARTLGRIAVEAGRLVAAFTDRRLDHRLKEDGSPATAADLASEQLIVERLAAAFPGVPVVAEESVGGAAACPAEGAFFLVDPLDGTKDYVSGAGEYAVNIALVSTGRPVAAAIAAPASRRVWVAGDGAWEAPFPADPEAGENGFAWTPIRARATPPDGVVALVSRRHGDADTESCLGALGVSRREAVSSAAKFGLIACGEADLYVRCGPTMEWDTAAGDHILLRAGGRVIGADGQALRYGRAEDGYLNGAFAAMGDPALATAVRGAMPGGASRDETALSPGRGPA